LENAMSVATITQAQDKSLRHQFAGIASEVLEFCRNLYTAHGGAVARARRATEMSSPQVAALADRYKQYAPSLSVELHFLASRG
jgi:hypothetical protein